MSPASRSWISRSSAYRETKSEMPKPIRRVLIANRGEIAVRVNRSCRDMGIETVQVYSKADRDSLAVRLADRALCIGATRSCESYLDKPLLVQAAKAFGSKGSGARLERSRDGRRINRLSVDRQGPNRRRGARHTPCARWSRAERGVLAGAERSAGRVRRWHFVCREIPSPHAPRGSADTGDEANVIHRRARIPWQ